MFRRFSGANFTQSRCKEEGEHTVFSECAADDGPGGGAHSPHRAHEAEILAALPQRHEVRDDDFREGDDAAAADALEGAAGEEDGEGVGDGADDGADGEEKEGGEELHRCRYHFSFVFSPSLPLPLRPFSAKGQKQKEETHQRLPPENMRETRVDRLEDRARQQERRPGPEGLDGGAVDCLCDDGQRDGDGGGVEGRGEGDGAEGREGEVEAPSGVEAWGEEGGGSVGGSGEGTIGVGEERRGGGGLEIVSAGLGEGGPGEDAFEGFDFFEERCHCDLCENHRDDGGKGLGILGVLVRVHETVKGLGNAITPCRSGSDTDTDIDIDTFHKASQAAAIASTIYIYPTRT